FLGDIPPQLPSYNFARIGVEADNAEIHIVLVIENANFGLFRWRLPFERLPLQEICDWTCHLPCGIVERAIQFRRMLNANRLCHSNRLLSSCLAFSLLRATLLLCKDEGRSQAHEQQHTPKRDHELPSKECPSPNCQCTRVPTIVMATIR